MRVPSSKFQVSSLALIALLASCAAASAQPPAQPFDRAQDKPVAELTLGGISVAIYREPCALAAVANLPYRATWHDPRRGYFEGCYTAQHHTIVVCYFDDRTVVTLPLAQFGPPAKPRPTDRES